MWQSFNFYVPTKIEELPQPCSDAAGCETGQKWTSEGKHKFWVYVHQVPEPILEMAVLNPISTGCLTKNWHRLCLL